MKPAVLAEQRAGEAVRGTGHFMHMPAADANLPLVGGVRHARIDPNDPVARRFQIDAAAGATESAGGELGKHGLIFTAIRVTTRDGW